MVLLSQILQGGTISFKLDIWVVKVI